MLRQWRLIYDQPTNGQRNMAIDDAILQSVGENQSPPTLRIYGWHPACLSLGYAQSAKDADIDRILERGWEIVRRPTGGKAILHVDEVTYSVAVPADHPLANGTIIESYRHISEALIIALERIGLQPESQPKDPNTSGAGAVCFEVPSHYEITVGGRKLIGSAQVRRKNGVLQHGTLPLTGDITRICEALAYPDDSARLTAKAQVKSRALTLEDALGHRVYWTEVADAIAYGFAMAFNITFDHDANQLTDYEQTIATLLEQDRYAQLERLKAR